MAFFLTLLGCSFAHDFRKITLYFMKIIFKKKNQQGVFS